VDSGNGVFRIEFTTVEVGSYVIDVTVSGKVTVHQDVTVSGKVTVIMLLTSLSQVRSRQLRH
jgi:hypothetical protein